MQEIPIVVFAPPPPISISRVAMVSDLCRTANGTAAIAARMCGLISVGVSSDGISVRRCVGNAGITACFFAADQCDPVNISLQEVLTEWLVSRAVPVAGRSDI